MTDAPTPPTDDDLSAYLDGEADEALVARIEADPIALARVGELRHASATLRALPEPTLPADAVDALISQAMTTGAQPADGSADAGPGHQDSIVAPLAPPSHRRAASSWMVAAAIVALVAIGLGLVWSGTHEDSTTSTDVAAGGSTNDDRATSKAADQAGSGASSTADRTTGAEAAVPDAAGTDAEASPTTVSPAGGNAGAAALVDLGEFDSPEALRRALATAFPDSGPPQGTDAGSGPDPQAVTRCAGLIQEVMPVEGDPLRVGYARVDGAEVVVYEYRASTEPSTDTTTSPSGPAPTALIIGVRPAACDQVIAFQR